MTSSAIENSLNWPNDGGRSNVADELVPLTNSRALMPENDFIKLAVFCSNDKIAPAEITISLRLSKDVDVRSMYHVLFGDYADKVFAGCRRETIQKFGTIFLCLYLSSLRVFPLCYLLPFIKSVLLE